MTLEEFARLNGLALNETKDKLVVVPVGRFRYYSYPLGKFDVNPETGTVVESAVVGSVEITQDEFCQLLGHQVCWEDGKLIPYTMSDELVACKELINTYIKMSNDLREARQWLADKDYIGIKIAHVALTGTQEDIDALKIEYADVIKEANEKRALVNTCTEWLEANGAKRYEAEATLNKEFETE